MSIQEKILNFWHSTKGITPLLRDIMIAGLVLLILIGALWGITGQPFPQAPLVVIESGSMMHADSGFGKWGTIDPGDLVFVIAIHSKDDVVTHGSEKFGEASKENSGYNTYGNYGNVLIYHPDKNSDGSITDPWDANETPIIHRAMCWITAIGVFKGGEYIIIDYNEKDDFYVVQDDNGAVQELHVEPESILYTVEEYLILREKSIDLDDSLNPPMLGLTNYKPKWSGFITKGDNNEICDQASSICPVPIQVDWVIGKAAFEIPWFGLIKLAIFGNSGAYPEEDWTTIGFATAPTDCWIMLGASLVILISIPVSLDVYDYFKKRREEKY